MEDVQTQYTNIQREEKILNIWTESMYSRYGAFYLSI